MKEIFYFCKRCQIKLDTYSIYCVECGLDRVLEVQKKYRATDKAKKNHNIAAKNWHKKNKDKVKLYRKMWIKKNPDYYKKYTKGFGRPFWEMMSKEYVV